MQGEQRFSKEACKTKKTDKQCYRMGCACNLKVKFQGFSQDIIYVLQC